TACTLLGRSRPCPVESKRIESSPLVEAGTKHESMEMNGATRALLIEDNPDDACLLGEALNEARDASIELVHVEQLTEAANLLKATAFDVILLDLSLPDSQGIETVLRMQTEAPAIPIIVLTGLDDDNVALQAV